MAKWVVFSLRVGVSGRNPSLALVISCLFLFVFCVCCFLFFVIGGVIFVSSHVYYGCIRTYQHYVCVCNMHV